MPVDPAVGAAGVAVDVRLLGVEDVLDRPAEVPQGDEELLVVLRRAAQVRLGLEHQQRRADARDVAQRRLAPELVDALGAERVAEQRDPVVLRAGVGVGPVRDLVGDAVLGDGRPEPVGRADQPVDHEPAVAQAEDAEPVGVGEPERDDVVDGRVDVVGVDAAPVAELRADPVAPVRRRAADVGQDDAVAARDEERDLDVRRGRPRAERPAVDVDDRRERARRRHPAARRSRRRSAPPAPGACVRRITGCGYRRCHAAPILVRTRGVPVAAVVSGPRTSVVSSIARVPSVPSQDTTPGRRRRERVDDDVAIDEAPTVQRSARSTDRS